MPNIKLLGDLATSPYTCKVRIVLGEKNIPFDYVPESLVGGEANPAIPYNPLGKVPVIVMDDGNAIFDSRVIIGYLELLAPSPALLPPGGMERVAVRRWEALGDGLCDAGRACKQEGKRPNKNPDVRHKQTRKFERGLEMASKELGDNQWCHGNAYSLADIAIGTAIAWIGFFYPQNDPRKRHPNLRALHQRLMQRPVFASATTPFV